jgi:erythritol kinase
MGDIPAEVRVTGGAARSGALRLIMASTLNAPVRTVAREEAGAAGAAMMAAVQQKVFADMKACADQWVEPLLGTATVPDAGLVAAYGTAFVIYRKAREAMRPIWKGMAEARQGGAHAA